MRTQGSNRRPSCQIHSERKSKWSIKADKNGPRWRGILDLKDFRGLFEANFNLCNDTICLNIWDETDDHGRAFSIRATDLWGSASEEVRLILSHCCCDSDRSWISVIMSEWLYGSFLRLKKSGFSEAKHLFIADKEAGVLRNVGCFPVIVTNRFWLLWFRLKMCVFSVEWSLHYHNEVGWRTTAVLQHKNVHRKHSNFYWSLVLFLVD